MASAFVLKALILGFFFILKALYFVSVCEQHVLLK